MIMNIEPISTRGEKKKVGPHSHKHTLADVWVLPVSSLGKSSDDYGGGEGGGIR